MNVLGSPDNGVILSSYIGSWLMAGAFLALAAAISALTKSRVLAFIAGTAVSFLFVMAGFDLEVAVVRQWAPGFVVVAVRSMSFFVHFQRLRHQRYRADGWWRRPGGPARTRRVVAAVRTDRSDAGRSRWPLQRQGAGTDRQAQGN